MSNAADDVIRAFITAFSANKGHVVFRQRGSRPGYLHVVPAGFDPALPEDRHLAVELYNGTVCISEDLQINVKAQERPNVSIRKHPCGTSAGNSGKFRWALSHQEIVEHRGGVHAFAEEIARLYLAIPPYLKRG